MVGARAAVVVAIGSTGEAGAVLATLLVEEAGGRVTDRHVVAAGEAGAVAARAAATADLVIVVGPGATAAVASKVEERFTTFEAVFGVRSLERTGEAALFGGVAAGRLGRAVLIGVPGDDDGVRLAIGELAWPALVARAAGAPSSASEPKPPAPNPPGPNAVAPTNPPVTSGPTSRSVGVGAAAIGAGTPPPASDEAPSGWVKALQDLGGTLDRERRVPLPEVLEGISPVIDVLHTAGETATWVRPDGGAFGVYGWPDLRRPSSRVLAIRAGEPWGEILALHRVARTGTSIDEARGLARRRFEDVQRVAEEITGRAPKSPDGKLFAVQGDAVWIQRANRVIRWDGAKEHDEGTPKQALASLVLAWSNR
jgi:hypothetical protein